MLTEAREPTPREANDDAALLALMQLSSSFCPVGAFAYSQGLEGAYEAGLVSSDAELESWLSGVGSETLSGLDLPVLERCHRAARAGDLERALELSARLLAFRESSELRSQEQQLGLALARVLEALGVPLAARLAGDERASYVVSYAVGAAHHGISADRAALGYAFAWAEQQVSAATRLMPLGHLAAQRILSNVLSRVPDWVREARERSDRDIGNLTHALAMASAWHERQYSRLFRS